MCCISFPLQLSSLPTNALASIAKLQNLLLLACFCCQLL
jgi:hypothetical protein